MRYGLSEKTRALINHIFAEHKEIDKVILYGSRAKGNFRTGSDIDLTLMGKNINLKTLFRIEEKLDDLLLPYIIDLSIFNHIENPDLIDHIKRVGKVFFDKQVQKQSKAT